VYWPAVPCRRKNMCGLQASLPRLVAGWMRLYQTAGQKQGSILNGQEVIYDILTFLAGLLIIAAGRGRLGCGMRSKHILVPLDLVRGPASALVFVQQMAAETPVRVTLLHVVDLNIFPPQPAVNDQLCTESQAALRKLAKLFFGAEQAVRIIVRAGQPAGEIIAEAQAAGADLIVMCGPKSRRLRLLRRGTTQRVLNSASCPTLVLPHPGQPGRGKPARIGSTGAEEACFFGEEAARAALG
jgi:nucleotide-binding universal stress UspA family protein